MSLLPPVVETAERSLCLNKLAETQLKGSEACDVIIGGRVLMTLGRDLCIVGFAQQIYCYCFQAYES